MILPPQLLPSALSGFKAKSDFNNHNNKQDKTTRRWTATANINAPEPNILFFFHNFSHLKTITIGSYCKQDIICAETANKKNSLFLSSQNINRILMLCWSDCPRCSVNQRKTTNQFWLCLAKIYADFIRISTSGEQKAISYLSGVGQEAASQLKNSLR